MLLQVVYIHTTIVNVPTVQIQYELNIWNNFIINLFRKLLHV